MHLDFDQATAFTVFATATFYIEAKTSRIVPAYARRWELTEQLAYRCEGARVGDRVRAGRAANRALIDHDRLIELVASMERAMLARLILGIVKMSEERTPQNVIDQSRFAAARYACHTGETTDRERGGHIFQVVLRGFRHRQPSVSGLAGSRRDALSWNRNACPAGKIICGR